MEREVQTISLKSVWRPRMSPVTHQEEAFGQVFAFDANAIEKMADEGHESSHVVLLRIMIPGLWEARPKQPVLAGYIPGTERTPICRVYLMSARPCAWGPFHKTFRESPAYLETSEDFIVGNHVPAVWWENPCTMVALWPRPTEQDPQHEEWTRLGGPGEEWGQLYKGDRCYRFMQRYFEIVD
jgi:hypothetical protein